MKERVLSFGENRRLVGVLTQPATPLPDAPAAIIPNTGVDHRVGPNRLHVQLARALADAGVPVLRMDLSGMGDSLPPPAGSVQDSVLDQRAAMDELARLGIAKRFLALGICSGAHDAHRLTVADPRVVGGAYVDHYAFPTPEFKRRYWTDRVFDTRRAANFLRRKLGSAGKDKNDLIWASDDLLFFERPTREQFAAQLETFVQRRLALFFLYTGEVQSEYNYREQLTDGFPVLLGYPRLSLHFAPGADHTFTRRYMRDELVALLRTWAVEAARP